MNILFRCDANSALGYGHFKRCLSLAITIKRENPLALITFLSYSLPEQLKYELKLNGFTWHHLNNKFRGYNELEYIQHYVFSNNVDLLILDHYDFSSYNYQQLYSSKYCLFVIDELRNRDITADIFLDQTYGILEADYGNKLEKCGIILLGTSYALLHPDFHKSRTEKKFNKISNILISMGGSDPQGLTIPISNVLLQNQTKYNITVVLPQNYKYIDKIEKISSEHDNLNIALAPENLISLYTKTDICIGTAGTSTWERACIGIPCLTVKVAENQKFIIKNMKKGGLCSELLLDHIYNSSLLKYIISKWLTETDFQSESENLKKLVDGLGTIRVYKVIRKAIAKKKGIQM